MRDDAGIKNYVANVVEGSRVPVERREEVAEELRGHLEELVDTKCDAGFNKEAAIEAALSEFGSPELIRHQLQRQQRNRDHSDALTRVRGSLRSISAISAIPSILIILRLLLGCAVLGVVPPLWFVLWYVLAVTTLFAVMFLAVLPVVYVYCLAAVRMKQQLPRGEFRFFHNTLHWFSLTILSTGIFAAFFSGGLIGMFGILSIGIASATDMLIRFSRLWLGWGRELLREGSPTILVLTLSVALVLAGYQRWQCVPDAAESAA